MERGMDRIGAWGRWLGLAGHLSATSYALALGAVLAVKWGAEALVLAGLHPDLPWTPADSLSPLLAGKEGLAQRDLLLPYYVWSLLALWALLGLSVRRARDAGFAAAHGLLIVVPVVNAFTAVVLCMAPTRSSGPLASGLPPGVLASTLVGVAVACAIGVAMAPLSVFSFAAYGSALFVATPFAMGLACGYVYCRGAHRSLGATLAVACLALAVTGTMLLALALEGAVCLAMAYPVAVLPAAAGSLLGRALAARGRPLLPMGAALLLLPLLMGFEAGRVEAPLREVVTSVEIDAPPAAVWPHVVGFSELPPPSRWVFRLGIAHPRRARIEGSGVGAVRHCEFSTGAFVEPITVWDPPRRLAFDVVSQPDPMHEWSPYQNVNAPHLVDGMRSERGEFRLVALAGGRTRLEGSTWYRLEMAPQLYWTRWSDLLIHSIHRRVLEHVKNLAES